MKIWRMLIIKTIDAHNFNKRKNYFIDIMKFKEKNDFHFLCILWNFNVYFNVFLLDYAIQPLLVNILQVL